MPVAESKTASSLVGRSEEIRSLQTAIDALQAGSGGMLMLAGEPGIGKSSLAQFAADLARKNSIPAYWGFSWEAGGAPAYWPWTQILEQLVRDHEPDAGLVANLNQLLPDLESPTSEAVLQPNQAKFQLLEAVRRLIDEISKRTPLLLVFEDLHAADGDSLHLLHYIARHVASLPVLVIGTFREVEARAMEGGDPLWRACRDARVLQLSRLDRNSIREYLVARGEVTVSESDVEKIYETTEGNPLFMSELVSLLSRGDMPAAGLPVSVQQVIRQQIALMPETTVELLTNASVIGREFEARALAELSASTAQQVETELRATMIAGLLRMTPDGSYRFSHTLQRDVLYEDIDAASRTQLHEKYADYLQQLVDTGDADRWAELATHLGLAGDDHRDAAIDASRHAARRARGRLAFDDAAMFLQGALRAFGDGPRFEPIQRFRLLLDCAEATLLTGDTETGYRYCRDAFELARTLEDASLMAEASLTWGGSIVVAQVDAEMIGALQESLAALSGEDAALRAQVQARLAGAMQPAPDPNEPMEMARDAIALARSTGDEQVIYRVLHSAMSALMDFSLPEERMPLNEEFGALAEKFGDVPGQFRSKLRLMIDACEAADRDKMDKAIDDCHKLATLIGLPHYRWRAESARAMQAMIDGQFARASALLDSAQRYADEIGDLEASVTLPMQRFAILIDWQGDQGETLEGIEGRLRDAYAKGMAPAEEFVAPFIASYSASPDVAFHMLGNRQLIARTFAGGDRYSLCRVGEMAAAAGNKDIALRAYQALLPYADSCVTPGLMGSSCTGPTAWSIGIIAKNLGKTDQAMKYLDQALGTAEAMRSPPWIARIHKSLAEVARMAGDDSQANQHDEQSRNLFAQLELRPRREAPAGEDGTVAKPASTQLALQRDGELWKVSFNGQTSMLKASRGLDMLAKLVETPETDIHVLDLSGGQAVVGQQHAAAAVDDKARAEYEKRINELREELAEAEQFGDVGRADAARQEIDFITRELSRAFGLGGRRRAAGDAAERARVNVRRRLKDAIERIGKQDESAGRYLKNTVKTGIYCRYTPL